MSASSLLPGRKLHRPSVVKTDTPGQGAVRRPARLSSVAASRRRDRPQLPTVGRRAPSPLTDEAGHADIGSSQLSSGELGGTSASSSLTLTIAFAANDDAYALGELTRILKRIAARHGD
jgi:hypothetical protein